MWYFFANLRASKVSSNGISSCVNITLSHNKNEKYYWSWRTTKSWIKISYHRTVKLLGSCNDFLSRVNFFFGKKIIGTTDNHNTICSVSFNKSIQLETSTNEKNKWMIECVENNKMKMAKERNPSSATEMRATPDEALSVVKMKFVFTLCDSKFFFISTPKTSVPNLQTIVWIFCIEQLTIFFGCLCQSTRQNHRLIPHSHQEVQPSHIDLLLFLHIPKLKNSLDKIKQKINITLLGLIKCFHISIFLQKKQDKIWAYSPEFVTTKSFSTFWQLRCVCNKIHIGRTNNNNIWNICWLLHSEGKFMFEKCWKMNNKLLFATSYSFINWTFWSALFHDRRNQSRGTNYPS